MKHKEQAKNILRGALILTIAALLTKILSAFYRIPFQNIVGDVGFYIYQQVYPFYGIAVTLSTYGFPVVISKLYAEETAKAEQSNVKQLLVTAMLFLFGFGLICFVLLFGGAPFLANHMNDPQLTLLFRVIAVAFLFMPIIALLRGFFQGTGDMVPTAVSQVGEQFVRVVTILVAAVLLVSQSYSLYIVGSGAAFGSITGGLVSALILFFYWQHGERKVPITGYIDFKQSRKIVKTLMIQGFTVCISSMLLIFIQLADSLNLYSLLVDSGIGSETAKELKGIYDRGQPLIQLGTVVATSMSLSLVPLITRENMRKNAVALTGKLQLALKMSILVGVGATMGLWNIIRPTNIMLFENTAGSTVLAVQSTIILLASVIMTMTAIFQGLGNTLFPALAILTSFVLKYGLNLLFVPKFATMGAAIASLITLLVILAVFIVKLRMINSEVSLSKQFYLVIGLAGFVMMLVLNGFLYATDFIYESGHSNRILVSLQALSAVLIGGFMYLFIILKGNLFKAEELSLLPFGSKLMFFLPKGNRR